jgi:hypothetical protein
VAQRLHALDTEGLYDGLHWNYYFTAGGQPAFGPAPAAARSSPCPLPKPPPGPSTATSSIPPQESREWLST